MPIAPSRSAPVSVDAVVPLYHRVYTALRQQLLEARYPPERALPGEPSLARHFGVARITIRRALQQLEAEGLVVRNPSRGTYPAKAASPSEPRANISGLFENLVTVGRKTAAKLLSFEEVAPPHDVARHFQSGDRVLRIERLRLVGGTPISFYSHYLPRLTAGAVSRAALGSNPVLSLLQDAGFTAATAEQALTARTADADVAEAMQVPVGTALVCLKRLVRDDRNRPIEYHESLYRPDRYEYQLTLVRGGSPTAPAWVPLPDADKETASIGGGRDCSS